MPTEQEQDRRQYISTCLMPTERLFWQHGNPPNRHRQTVPPGVLLRTISLSAKAKGYLKVSGSLRTGRACLIRNILSRIDRTAVFTQFKVQLHA